MLRLFCLITVLGLAAAYDSTGTNTNPFDDTSTDTTNTGGDTTDTSDAGDVGDVGDVGDIGDVGGDDGSGITGSPERPPSTDQPDGTSNITRFENRDGTGGGFVTSVIYTASDGAGGSDTLTIDNLGFDGTNIYERDNQVGTLKSFAVYEADVTYRDDLTGEVIPQIAPYCAIYGVSNNAVDGESRTSFAIVRTGAYASYGYGGFEVPTAGQAVFNGDYAGIRVFNGLGGIQYTRGDMQIPIDFEDFNKNNAVKGRIYNREAFNASGGATTVVDGVSLPLPNINFVIQKGVDSLDDNGERSGNAEQLRLERRWRAGRI